MYVVLVAVQGVMSWKGMHPNSTAKEREAQKSGHMVVGYGVLALGTVGIFLGWYQMKFLVISNVGYFALPIAYVLVFGSLWWNTY